MKIYAKLWSVLLATIIALSFAGVSCSNSSGGGDNTPVAPGSSGTENPSGVNGGSESGQTVTTFTVTFQTERGNLPTNFKNGITVNANTKLTAEQLPGLTSSGWAFGGWQDGDTLVVAGEYTVTKTVTLTAKWTVATVMHTVSFTSEHGTVPQSLTLPENTVLMETNAPTLIEEGWRFDGWFDGTTKIEVGSYILTKDVTLTAKWTAGYIIHFDADGGMGTMPDQFIVPNGDYIKIAKNLFKKDGYVFDGWMGDEQFFGGKTYDEVDFIFAKTDSPIYYNLRAIWVKLLLVTYESVYGTVPQSFYLREDRCIPSEQLPVLTNENYYFDGWYIGETYVSIGNPTFINTDTTLTARWKPKSREVQYYVNNSYKKADTFYYSITEPKEVYNYSQSNANFIGWKKDKESSVVDFLVGTNISYSDIPSNGPLKLYAHFMESDGQVSIDISKAVELINKINQISTTSTFYVNVTGNYSDNAMKNITDILKDVSTQQNNINLDFTGLLGMTMVNDHEFEKCRYVKNIVLPDGVETIGEYAFASTTGCQVEIPDTVCMIKPFAFKGCVINKIPTSLTCIGESAFRGLKALPGNVTTNGLEIPNTVRRIDKFAFSNAFCHYRVIIPSSVRYIDWRAFAWLTDDNLISTTDPYVDSVAMYGLGTSNWNTEFAKWYTSSSGFDDVDSKYKSASGKQVTTQWREKYKKYDYSSITEQELAKHFNGKERFKTEAAWFKRE